MTNLFVRLDGGSIAQFPYSISEFRKDNPHTSFPSVISPQILSPYGVFPVTLLERPSYDQMTQEIIRDELPHKQNINWVVGFTARNLPQDQAEANVRAHRGYLLQESDWIVSVSYERAQAVPAAWASYRQALRDITAQEGFPYSVVWPTKPE